MKILVTGKNSFIGRYFKENNKLDQIEEVCLVENNIDAIDFSRFDVVFHVAAIVHQSKHISEEYFFKINSDLAYNVAKKAKEMGVKHFVFMSTVKVYGENNSKNNVWTETSKCYPQDAYGRSKLDAENRFKVLNDEEFVISIVRTPVVYGSGVKGNIQRIAKFVLNSKLIPLGGIENKRAMVNIANLNSLVNRIIELRRGGLFLAGDKNLLSTSEFVQYLIKYVRGRKYMINFPRVLKILVKLILPKFYIKIFGTMLIDNKMTCKQLDFTPPCTEEEGLKQVIEFIR